MFFLLRCALWLSIVYASILLPHLEWRQTPSVAASPTPDIAEQAKQQAVTTALDYCRSRASGCLNEAARLTALIASVDDAAAVTPAKPAARPAPHLIAQARDPIAVMLTRGR